MRVLVQFHVDGFEGFEAEDSQEEDGKVWHRVDNTNKPLIRRARACTRTWCGFTIGGKCIVDAEIRWEGKVGAVGSRLIPSLNRGGDGAQDDGEV